MKIHLHVGAHKTATTFLQSLLAKNLKKLNRNGVGYVPLAEMRRSLTRSLAGSHPTALRLQDILSQFFPHGTAVEPRGIIISDENIAGSCGRFMKTGELYSEASRRLGCVREALDGHEVRLLFSIRSYDTFLASAYCEAMRQAEIFIPFDEFRARFKQKQSSWPIVLSRIVNALQPDETVVWRYEDLRANSAAIIRMLAFDVDIPNVADGERLPRASFSQAAVDILDLVAASHGAAVAARLVKSIAKSLAKTEGFPEFYPWSDAERDEYRRLYAEDCTALAPVLLKFPEPPALPLLSPEELPSAR